MSIEEDNPLKRKTWKVLGHRVFVEREETPYIPPKERPVGIKPQTPNPFTVGLKNLFNLFIIPQNTGFGYFIAAVIGAVILGVVTSYPFGTTWMGWGVGYIVYRYNISAFKPIFSDKMHGDESNWYFLGYIALIAPLIGFALGYNLYRDFAHALLYCFVAPVMVFIAFFLIAHLD